MIYKCISTQYPVNTKNDFLLNIVTASIPGKMLDFPKINIYNPHKIEFNYKIYLEKFGNRYVFVDSIIQANSFVSLTLPSALTYMKVSELYYLEAKDNTSLNEKESVYSKNELMEIENKGEEAFMLDVDIIGYAQQSMTDLHTGIILEPKNT